MKWNASRKKGMVVAIANKNRNEALLDDYSCRIVSWTQAALRVCYKHISVQCVGNSLLAAFSS
jgi:hypothetical protein